MMIGPELNLTEQPQLRSLVLTTWWEAQKTYGDVLPAIAAADPDQAI